MNLWVGNCPVWSHAHEHVLLTKDGRIAQPSFALVDTLSTAQLEQSLLFLLRNDINEANVLDFNATSRKLSWENVTRKPKLEVYEKWVEKIVCVMWEELTYSEKMIVWDRVTARFWMLIRIILWVNQKNMDSVSFKSILGSDSVPVAGYWWRGWKQRAKRGLAKFLTRSLTFSLHKTPI